MPRLYRHHPLRCVPLYHELGHFIDLRYGVVTRALLLKPVDQNPALTASIPSEWASSLARAELEYVVANHLREFFSDLFGASYCGSAYREFMNEVFPDAGASPTHPAMKDRLDILNAFVADQPHPIIEALSVALSALVLPSLVKRFQSPNVDK